MSRTTTPDPDRTAPVRLPSESDLTHEGLSEASPDGRVLLVACGALAREVLDIRQTGGWAHLDLHCLPAILHNRPERIPGAVRDIVERRGGGYARVYVLYGDCGTGGALQRTCDELGIEMLAGPHCYSFFEGNVAFAERGEVTCFYLTDFLVRQFDAFVWEPLGLARHPDLRDMYFGNYETLVYQAQTDDPALTALARRHAERLGLDFERRFTGYGDLAASIAHWADGSEPGRG